MAAKCGPTSPELVPNPFIKRRNLEWTIELDEPARDIDDSNSDEDLQAQAPKPDDQPKAAVAEASDAKVEDHLEHFSGILNKALMKPFPDGMPQLAISDYRSLYTSSFGNPGGAHFIIHQHDHPIAGTHYDLRLQINETSSASWAIMYGLPGDPNSERLNRNATETRVHRLWNHLIETASRSTGSLIIWDTGTYTVLERRSKHAPAEDPDSQPLSQDSSPELTEQEKLHRAFQDRKIRIQLHGTRLPHNYVLNLRLTQGEDTVGRAKIGRRPKTRSRRGGGKLRAKVPGPNTSSDSESEPATRQTSDENEDIVKFTAEADEGVSAMEREIRELEDEEIRRTNAYTGASNTIESVHQRRWYLSLDREGCGFVKRRKAGRFVWESEQHQNAPEDGRLSFPFYVRGAEVEHSVVTGRQDADVLRDEGVTDFVKRKGWQAVLN